MTALYAALHAPWVRNIRPLIDPSQVGRVESTWSFLFGFPAMLTVVLDHGLCRPRHAAPFPC